MVNRQWCFIREWGRIGLAGQVFMVPYATATEAARSPCHAAAPEDWERRAEAEHRAMACTVAQVRAAGWGDACATVAAMTGTGEGGIAAGARA
jgi:predicted DNA-binding WGR domain protein